MNSKSPATLYFLDYWDDLFNGISQERDLLKSFNPRVVVRELLDEITLNKITNKVNEDFFKRTLSNYFENDPASKMRFKTPLQLMLKEIDLSKCRPRYLPRLCRSAISIFENFEYFEDCIESLISIIDSAQLDSSTKSDIKHIANHLIVELREIGYSDKEIASFSEIIFSNIHYIENKPMWSFPHEMSCSDWKNEDEISKYKRNLELCQSSLTEKDRIRSLLIIARKEKESFGYLFKVYGMTGTIEQKVSGVLFYSPLKKRLINYDDEMFKNYEPELFGYKNYGQPINSYVLVDAISIGSGERIARARIEKSLEFCRRIMQGESRLWLSKSYIVLNKDNNILEVSRHTFENPDSDFTKFISLDSEIENDVHKKLSIIEKTKQISEANGWGKKFNEACYWLKRGDESDSNVDKLLSYWICIETLCAKSEDDDVNWFVTNGGQKETDISLIREVVGKMRAVSKCYRHGWMIHNKLSSENSNLNIPEHLKIKAQLQLTDFQGQTIFLKNLIDCVEEIKNHLLDGLLKEQVVELHNFYEESKVAQKALKTHLQSTQDEVALIYRMRNKIAHDGSSQNPLLPSLCTIANDYAVSLFSHICEQVVNQNERDLSSILISTVQNFDLISIRLDTEKPIKVFLTG